MSETRSNNEIQALFPLIVLIVITAVMVFAFTPRPTRQPTAEVAAAVTPVPTAEATAVAAQPTPEMDHQTLMALGLEQVNASAVRRGSRLFGSSCSACHGINALGISGLGKTLIGSAFVDSLNDDELVQFVIVGRTTQDPLNTTGQVMPARGNNPGLTDDDLHAIVDYIRSLNGATVINDIADETPVVVEVREFQPLDLSGLNAAALQGGAVVPTPAETAVAAADPAQVLYERSCASCHAVDGKGVAGANAGDLTAAPFDAEAFFIEMTVPSFDMSGGFVHPLRGGFPQLTDDEINAIIAYVQAWAP